MSDEYLLAVYKGSNTFGYYKPASWKCYEFGSCWQPSVGVMRNLPSTNTALYVSDKCEAGGQFHYISDKRDTKGQSNLLNKARKFQSMMVGEYLNGADRPSVVYSKKCSTSVQEHGSMGANETAVTYISTSSAENGSAENDSTSLNWYDTLPEI